MSDLPIFISSDSYGNICIAIRGKRYEYATDAVYHPQWIRMLKSPNPKLRWKAVNQMKDISDTKNQPKPQITKPREKQLTFKNWINEGVLDFGARLKGRSTENLPISTWQWLKDAMDKSPRWVPKIIDDNGKDMSYTDVVNLVNSKLGLGPQNTPQRNVPQQKTPQQSIQQMQPQKPQLQVWYKTSVIAPFDNLKVGEIAAVTQGSQGWEYLNKNGEQGTIPSAQVQQIIKSEIGADGQKVKSSNPEEFFTGELSSEVRTTQMTTGRNGKSIVIPEKFMTQYNKEIASRFTETNDPITISALAGTGKTTMLKHLSSYKRPNERWLYLVFNKKNQVESRQAFPEGVDVLTTHAFLGRILKLNGKEIGGEMQLPPPEQKGEKIFKVLNDLVPVGDKTFGKFRWAALNRIGKIAKLAKAFAINPDSPTISKELMDIVNRYAIDMDLSSEKVQQDRDYTDDMIRKTAELLKILLPNQLPKHMSPEFQNIRDQDDTLWFTALNADYIRWNSSPRYSVVLMDEVQDFNMCQLIMAKKLKESGARVVGVGDKNQSMYMFRGAVSDAFDQLQSTISGDSPAMNLPINFRSDPKIVNFVRENTHVKDLQATPSKGPDEGVVNTSQKYVDYLTSLIENYQKTRKFDGSHAVISRTNQPLVSTAMMLLKNNVDFQILGKDLSKELIDHIKKVTWQKPQNYDIMDLPQTISSYLNNVQNKWANNISKQDELKEIEATSSALISVLQHLQDVNFQDDNMDISNGLDFVTYIKKRLGGLDPDNDRDSKVMSEKDPNSYITLTTAHKSKGLEWDQIFVIKPGDFSPTKSNIKTPEEAQQERNCWYVTLTRAKHHLNVAVNDDLL